MAADVTISLLYLVNVSNPDRLSADSGWLYAETLAPALIDQGVRLAFAGPMPLSDPRALFYEIVPPTTKYRARFSSDIAALAALIEAAHPQVIVVNQVETAPAVRAAALEVGNAATLVAYCHYVPFSFDAGGAMQTDPSLDDGDLGVTVQLSFLAGLQVCDVVMVHSQTAKTWIRMAARARGLETPAHLHVIPPPLDPRVTRVEKARTTAQDGVLTAVYNHRLYRHYGTSRFVDLVERLAHLPVTVHVMDLFGSRRWERTRLDSSPEQYMQTLASMDNVRVLSDNGDRATYTKILSEADFGIAPFRPGCTWSMSVVDCMVMGLPVVAPRLGWLAESTHAELQFDSPDEAVRIVERLASEPSFRVRAGRAVPLAIDSLRPERVAAAYLAAVTR